MDLIKNEGYETIVRGKQDYEKKGVTINGITGFWGGASEGLLNRHGVPPINNCAHHLKEMVFRWISRGLKQKFFLKQSFLDLANKNCINILPEPMNALSDNQLFFLPYNAAWGSIYPNDIR